MRLEGEVSITDEVIYRAWQDNRGGLLARSERNDPKAHLRSFKTSPEGLTLALQRSDWGAMSLGPMLRDGKIVDPETSERYRDQILPDDQGVFNSSIPNHLVAHVAVLAGNHLVLTTRANQGLAFELGTISASVEQHINPALQNPLVDTVKEAVSKLDTAELKLTLEIDRLSVGALLTEPSVNNIGVVILAPVLEGSREIEDAIIGTGRRGEFAPDHPIRTLDLGNPDNVSRFLSTAHNLHGTSALRILVATSAVHGYEEALRIFHKAYVLDSI